MRPRLLHPLQFVVALLALCVSGCLIVDEEVVDVLGDLEADWTLLVQTSDRPNKVAVHTPQDLAFLASPAATVTIRAYDRFPFELGLRTPDDVETRTSELPILPLVPHEIWRVEGGSSKTTSEFIRLMAEDYEPIDLRIKNYVEAPSVGTECTALGSDWKEVGRGNQPEETWLGRDEEGRYSFIRVAVTPSLSGLCVNRATSVEIPYFGTKLLAAAQGDRAVLLVAAAGECADGTGCAEHRGSACAGYLSCSDETCCQDRYLYVRDAGGSPVARVKVPLSGSDGAPVNWKENEAGALSISEDRVLYAAALEPDAVEVKNLRMVYELGTSRSWVFSSTIAMRPTADKASLIQDGDDFFLLTPQGAHFVTGSTTDTSTILKTVRLGRKALQGLDPGHLYKLVLHFGRPSLIFLDSTTGVATLVHDFLDAPKIVQCPSLPSNIRVLPYLSGSILISDDSFATISEASCVSGTRLPADIWFTVGPLLGNDRGTSYRPLVEFSQRP